MYGGETILTLDDARAEFARFLADDPKARWRIDAALAHVVRWAYMRGRDDAVREELNELAREGSASKDTSTPASRAASSGASGCSSANGLMSA